MIEIKMATILRNTVVIDRNKYGYYIEEYSSCEW